MWIERQLPPLSSIERFRGGQGSASLGWIGGKILYGRFDGSISASLAEHVVTRFGELARFGAGGYYFLDASGVDAWQPLAFAEVADAILTHRRRFELSVARFPDLPSAMQRPPRDTIGIELVASDAAFEERLRVTAGQHYRPWAEPRPAAWTLMPGGVAAPTSLESQPAVYVYVFDLRNFEQGHFTAQRSRSLSPRPRGTWVCVARDDQRALVLARRAAATEWSRPITRKAEAFTVRFVDAPVEEARLAAP